MEILLTANCRHELQQCLSQQRLVSLLCDNDFSFLLQDIKMYSVKGGCWEFRLNQLCPKGNTENTEQILLISLLFGLFSFLFVFCWDYSVFLFVLVFLDFIGNETFNAYRTYWSCFSSSSMSDCFAWFPLSVLFP